ncbi:MAG: hypothetical protein KGL39_44315 [Patescibacteria group bacterium]|nr:hypothetical protein [Patescibacteria group bacterium]
MLIDLKAHYLDLLVGALEAAGAACLHRAETETKGIIYVTPSPRVTAVSAVLRYEFGEDGVALSFQSREKAQLPFAASYLEGLDDLWPQLARWLTGNRIEFKPGAAKGKLAA